MQKTLVIFLVVALGMLGYAAAQQETPTSLVDERFQKVNEWLKEESLTVTKSPEDAFVNDYVLVVAEGLPSATAKSPAQKRLTAKRAAMALAYRQLAEFIDGVAVVGDTLVKDAELQYDVVRTAVAGFVKGAQPVFEEYNEKEESAIVIMKIGMTGPTGFGKIMYEKLVGDPNVQKGVLEDNPSFKPAAPAALEDRYDGLVIDATEQTFRPALINRLFTPGGEVLYDPSKISQKVLVEQGCGEYTNTVDKAKAALGLRGVKAPLVIKASGTTSPSDLQVSDEDSVRIFSANQKTGFFAEAKVAFVLK